MGQNRRMEYGINDIDVDSAPGKTYTFNVGKASCRSLIHSGVLEEASCFSERLAFRKEDQ